MFRNKTARQHNFAVIPSAPMPRSRFRMKQTRKQAFDASDLIPIMCEEVLPGDTWQHHESIMARLATPIAPVLDDLDLETFYFFCPNRIIDKYPHNFVGGGGTLNFGQPGWEGFITGTVECTIPLIRPTQEAGPTWPVPVGSLMDHFGIPSGVYTAPLDINALPIYHYFNIWNEWFRDQNLQGFWSFDNEYTNTENTEDIEQASVPTGPIIPWDQMPLRVNKRHDYVTASLPFAQKGPSVAIGLAGQAPVHTSATDLVSVPSEPMHVNYATTGLPFDQQNNYLGTGANAGADANKMAVSNTPAGFAADVLVYPSNLYADLSTATSATINAIRLAVVTQQLLERDARGGSRYVENLLAHWGVRSPDYRLQRPEYLGGSKIPITTNPIAQTAAYDAEPGPTESAVGNLGAEMHAASGRKRSFTFAATEHGYIIGLCCVRATPTYQQGLRKHWGLRHTRLDYYDPLFANLGEQAVQTEEVYLPLNVTPVNTTWGFQENGAEYRYTPNEITGVLRSTAPQPLDWWHYAEQFGAEPALNAAFISDKTKETLARSLATAPSAQWSAQIIMDVVHDSNVMRLMPAYSVPGINRF